jgi:TetR/AcrR family transcriptional regulator, cholesterol catabolism regulator
MSSNNKELEIALAAVKLFEQKGYRATSVQDIADEVGLQKGSLYHYIQSKEDLLLQIAHQAITEFNTRLEDVLSQPISAKEKLALMIESHLQVSIANLQTTTVLLRETFALGEKPHQVIQDLTDRYLELLTSILEEGRRNGEFHIEDCKITALAILGSCNWMYRWYNPSGKLGSTELAQIFTQIFLNGVQNDKSP